jgi:DNA polymerase III delta prime subunit
MTSFVIISTDKQKRLDYAREYCSKLEISEFDITIIDKDTNPKQESIGIEDIKNIQGKIFLKPLRSQTKVIIIDDSQVLTIEAQNALLKVLEEPPSHTIIMLLSESKENLLPTIISRCKIIMLKEKEAKLSEEKSKEYEIFINRLPNLTIGERLKKAELLAKDKDKGIEWIEKLILVLREKMINSAIPSEVEESHTTELLKHGSGTRSLHAGRDDIINTLKKLQSLHAILKGTNANPRMAIEETLISL